MSLFLLCKLLLTYSTPDHVCFIGVLATDCKPLQSFITLYSSNIFLYVLGPPSAPSNPVPQPIDACSKKITWLPPFTLDGVPLFFNITITDASTQEIVDNVSTEDEEYTLSPRDLTGTYTVYVIAWNAAGSSDEVSSEVVFATEGVCTCECTSMVLSSVMLLYLKEVQVCKIINSCSCYSS